MNLVDYGSSDSENEDEAPSYLTQGGVQKQTDAVIDLPVPKVTQDVEDIDDEDLSEKVVDFNIVPQPKSKFEVIVEDENSLLPKKIDYGEIPKPPKSKKEKTRILIPSLSEFKNLTKEEDEDSRMKSAKKSTFASKLLSSIPPPKNSIVTAKTNSMVPHVLTKKNEVKKTNPPKSLVQKPVSQMKVSTVKSAAKTIVTPAKSVSSLSKSSLNYSDSEDEDDQTSGGTDFFSLSTPVKIPDDLLLPEVGCDIEDANDSKTSNFNTGKTNDAGCNLLEKTNKTLTSTVMNLPKEDILLKNKVEVGPKLPIPEQEYNVDTQGNLAFDEKAIEYLCGRRGVKRKNEFENVEILDINGEDIKPDERDWLVKALTEEQVIRPASANAGPSGTSKKKHQITYLAHQAKSMELELKNQWAQSNHNRQQSRSKYGF